MRREGLGVFPGKNQSCSPCRETHRTGGDYADYDAITIYCRPLDDAIGRERTSPSALWARRHPEAPAAGRNGPLETEYVFNVFKMRLWKCIQNEC